MKGLGRYILKRIAVIIPTFLGITFITYFIIRLAPGDPAELKVQQATRGIKSELIAKEIIKETRKLYGLDKPIWESYLIWLKRIVTFDFGNSYKDHRPVMDKIKEALPITLLLNIISILIAYIISVPLGIYQAIKKDSLFDRTTSLILFILYSIPSFWMAIMLIVFLGGGEYLNLFPIYGIHSDGYEELPFIKQVIDLIWHLVLPIITYTYGSFAFLAIYTRSSFLEVLNKEYIKSAIARGLSNKRVIFKHAFRNALIPIATLFGTLLPSLLGGSVIIEQIFSIPGMGRLSFEAVLSRDYPTIMAISAISAMLTFISLLITDIIYVFIDPRITFEKIEE